MTDKTTRALRRFHRDRMYRRARRIIQNFWWRNWSSYTEDDLHTMVSRHRDNMKICSCWMCRSPRKDSKGKEQWTIQERKAHESFITSLEVDFKE